MSPKTPPIPNLLHATSFKPKKKQKRNDSVSYFLLQPSEVTDDQEWTLENARDYYIDETHKS